MKQLGLLFIATVLCGKIIWAKEPHCASPDITPVFWGGAVVQYVKITKSLVFYVSPSIDKRFHKDIQAAANAWNEHLPADIQIEIAFSHDEWRSKIKTSKMLQLLELVASFSQVPAFLSMQPLREEPYDQTHDPFGQARPNVQLGYGRIGSIWEDPLVASTFTYAKGEAVGYARAGLWSQIWVNDRDFQFYATQDKSKVWKQYSFLNLMLHEMGHILGLNHNTKDPKSIMNPKVSRHLQRIGDSDIAAIRCAYGTALEPS